MPLASLHSLCQDDRNEVQHDFSGQALPLPLVLASHDAVSIHYATIAFLWSRQNEMKYGFCIVIQLPLALASHDAIGFGVTLCLWDQYQCNMMPTVS